MENLVTKRQIEEGAMHKIDNLEGQLKNLKEDLKNKKIEKGDLDRAIENFKTGEGRGIFYYRALELMKEEKYKIDAYLLILATWNFAHFRYAVTNFDLKSFEKEMDDLEKEFFPKLEDKDLENINFGDFKEDIINAFTGLSRINGIKYIGSSKILHLREPALFIMWDNSIKNFYGFKSKDVAVGYFDFLESMQEKFRGQRVDKSDITLAKAIDEYNYANITMPSLKVNKYKKLISDLKKSKGDNLDKFIKKLNAI